MRYLSWYIMIKELTKKVTMNSFKLFLKLLTAIKLIPDIMKLLLLLLGVKKFAYSLTCSIQSIKKKKKEK